VGEYPVEVGPINIDGDGAGTRMGPGADGYEAVMTTEPSETDPRDPLEPDLPDPAPEEEPAESPQTPTPGVPRPDTPPDGASSRDDSGESAPGS
jgi:hypothetical protein